MPYQIDKLTLGSPFFDRRTKLIPCQKMKVKMMYDSGNWGVSDLARVFLVDKNCIREIVDPEYHTRIREQNRIRNLNGRYYVRAANTRKVKAHRNYKSRLFAEMNPDLAIPRRKASVKPHRAIVLIKSAEGVIRLITTYSQHSAGLCAQKAGKIPGNAIITTWGKLKAYQDLHPRAVFSIG